MKQFKIYENPQGTFAAVKVGFCWPAFFFGIFWTLFAKLWKVAIVIFVASLFINMLGGSAHTAGAKEVMDLVSSLFGFAVMLILGFKGNEWRSKDIEARGYELNGTEIANNKDGAIAQYVRAQKAIKVPAPVSN